MHRSCTTKVNVIVKPTDFGLLGYTTATTSTVCTEAEKVDELKLTTEEKEQAR